MIPSATQRVRYVSFSYNVSSTHHKACLSALLTHFVGVIQELKFCVTQADWLILQLRHRKYLLWWNTFSADYTLKCVNINIWKENIKLTIGRRHRTTGKLSKTMVEKWRNNTPHEIE
jgi:hypothetical protein